MPTTTVVSLGQPGSANLGTLNLGGFNQEVAGLSSISGTNATASKNTVTSATDATLTLSGSGAYVYGAGTNANSGVITGSVSLVKNGSGSQTFGDANTYTGGTIVNSGTLIINNTTGSGTGSGAVTVSGGLLTGTGTISGPVVIESGGTLGGSLTIGGAATILGTHSPGNSPGIQTFNNGLTYGDGFSTPSVVWELIANTTTNAPNPDAVFDTITVTGDLSFIDPTTLSLVFNSQDSEVDWTHSLWTSNQQWLLYSYTGMLTGLENLAVANQNWADASSPTPLNFDDELTGNYFDFFHDEAGKQVFLRYNLIPEPSRALLAGLGLMGLLPRRRRA